MNLSKTIKVATITQWNCFYCTVFCVQLILKIENSSSGNEMKIYCRVISVQYFIILMSFNGFLSEFFRIEFNFNFFYVCLFVFYSLMKWKMISISFQFLVVSCFVIVAFIYGIEREIQLKMRSKLGQYTVLLFVIANTISAATSIKRCKL